MTQQMENHSTLFHIWKALLESSVASLRALVMELSLEKHDQVSAEVVQTFKERDLLIFLGLVQGKRRQFQSLLWKNQATKKTLQFLQNLEALLFHIQLKSFLLLKQGTEKAKARDEKEFMQSQLQVSSPSSQSIVELNLSVAQDGQAVSLSLNLGASTLTRSNASHQMLNFKELELYLVAHGMNPKNKKEIQKKIEAIYIAIPRWYSGFNNDVLATILTSPVLLKAFSYKDKKELTFQAPKELREAFFQALADRLKKQDKTEADWRLIIHLWESELGDYWFARKKEWGYFEGFFGGVMAATTENFIWSVRTYKTSLVDTVLSDLSKSSSLPDKFFPELARLVLSVMRKSPYQINQWTVAESLIQSKNQENNPRLTTFIEGLYYIAYPGLSRDASQENKYALFVRLKKLAFSNPERYLFLQRSPYFSSFMRNVETELNGPAELGRSASSSRVSSLRLSPSRPKESDGLHSELCSLISPSNTSSCGIVWLRTYLSRLTPAIVSSRFSILNTFLTDLERYFPDAADADAALREYALRGVSGLLDHCTCKNVRIQTEEIEKWFNWCRADQPHDRFKLIDYMFKNKMPITECVARQVSGVSSYSRDSSPVVDQGVFSCGLDRGLGAKAQRRNQIRERLSAELLMIPA